MIRRNLQSRATILRTTSVTGSSLNKKWKDFLYKNNFIRTMRQTFFQKQEQLKKMKNFFYLCGLSFICQKLHVYLSALILRNIL